MATWISAVDGRIVRSAGSSYHMTRSVLGRKDGNIREIMIARRPRTLGAADRMLLFKPPVVQHWTRFQPLDQGSMNIDAIDETLKS